MRCSGPGSYRYTFFLIDEDYSWTQVDTISIAECMIIRTFSLIDKAIQALCIFNSPRAALFADFGVEARDAVRWYLYIV